mmetsp:Transcript_379/g.853  ORF Transcript_379/g.853 Transcript_379/m.853 type:complete len:295 (-) Transcript_379:338-1222(-)
MQYGHRSSVVNDFSADFGRLATQTQGSLMRAPVGPLPCEPAHRMGMGMGLATPPPYVHSMPQPAAPSLSTGAPLPTAPCTAPRSPPPSAPPAPTWLPTLPQDQTSQNVGARMDDPPLAASVPSSRFFNTGALQMRTGPPGLHQDRPRSNLSTPPPSQPPRFVTHEGMDNTELAHALAKLLETQLQGSETTKIRPPPGLSSTPDSASTQTPPESQVDRVDSETLVAHQQGTCKPCIYQHMGGCRKPDCNFCHMEHDPSQLRRVRPSKSTRRCLQRRTTKLGQQEPTGATVTALSF